MDYKIAFLAVVITFVVFVVISIIIIRFKLYDLEQDIRNNSIDNSTIRSNLTDLKYKIIMLNDIPINEILWVLINKCGYKVETNEVKFELKKVIK